MNKTFLVWVPLVLLVFHVVLSAYLYIFKIAAQFVIHYVRFLLDLGKLYRSK